MEWEKLLDTERFDKGIKYDGDSFFVRYNKSEFDKDYQTIINSASFRRLQDKTQVFPLDKSDFVRTRLTHSIETSAIAKQLGNMVIKNIESFNKDIYLKNKDNLNSIPEILSCAGLLHDIGNPPFGHFGETVMGDWFKDNIEKIEFCGAPISEILTEEQICGLENFEGNAQALRAVSKLHYTGSDFGMNLTKSLLNVLVKYPVSSLKINKNHEDIKFHKLGYFDLDKSLFDEIAKSNGTILKDEYVRHPLTFLLEAADDIAYSTADLEDAYKKDLFSMDEFLKFYESQLKLFNENEDSKSYKLYFDLCDYIKKPNCNPNSNKNSTNFELVAMQKWLEETRNWLMYCSAYGFVKNLDQIMEGKYKNEILFDTYHYTTIKILKNAAIEFIFKNPEITKIEIAGAASLSFLLNKFINAVLYYDFQNDKYKQSKENKKIIDLLPDNYKENYKIESQNINSVEEKLYLRIHLVTDFICGMTDSYAKRLYQELSGIF